MRDLENCRQEIDEIDAELVRLFERRMGVCRDVALYKQAHYMDILNAAREEAVLKSRAQQAGDPALAQSVMALFTEIMRLSREEQRRYLEEQTETKRIAYSGVPGAYSECAVVGFFGDDCERVNFKTFEEVFAAVERKKNIRVRDRATLFNLLIGLNGYTVCSGVIDKKLNGKDIIAVPLADENDMRIGYITHRKGMLSRLGNTYLEAIKKYL